MTAFAVGAQPAAIDELSAILPAAADESVSSLMQRSEGGLVRRVQAPETPVAPDKPAGHRLRNAISDLEQMAKRG